MGFYRFSVLLLAVAVAGLLVGQPSAQATFVAVGVYDEQTTQTNAVDFDAPYDAANSTGVGANAGLVFGVNPFKPAVLAAFNSGNGGVVQFNNTSDIVAGSGTNSAIVIIVTIGPDSHATTAKPGRFAQIPRDTGRERR